MKRMFRRLEAAFLAVVCAVTVFQAALPVQSVFAEEKTAVTTDYLNLRAGKGTDTQILLTLAKGAKVTITDDSDPSWAKVLTESGREGYCSKQYLSYSGGSSATPSTAVTTDDLNLRKGPGLTYTILRTIPKGETVTILDNTNSQWAKVQYGNQEGYCSKEYLKMNEVEPPADPEGPGSQTETAVTTDYLNLRSGAGTSYRILLTIAKGARVTILEKTNSKWYRVRTANGAEGYCSTEYLKLESSPTDPEPDPEPDPSESKKAVTTDYLNLRKGPGTNYGIILTLNKGVTVQILDDSNPKWYRVQAGAQQGYCSTDYLKVEGGETPEPPPSEDPNEGEKATGVTTADLNLRKGPSTSYAILTTMKKGTTVTILDDSNPGWYRVQYGSQQGYCSAEYLEVKKPAPDPDPPEEPDPDPDPDPPEDPEELKAVTTDYLNLRSGPGTSYSILATLAKGVTVTVLDNSDTSWAKVLTESGKEGYCSKEYLKIQGGTEEPVPPPPPEEHVPVAAVVTADALNIRSAPSTSSTILGRVLNGVRVTILDASDLSWLKIQTSGGIVGYVSGQYVRLIYSDDPDTGATSLSLSNSVGTVPVGKTFYVKATYSPSDAFVRWTSSDTSVATVHDGLILAVGKGTATITASSGSRSATCKVTVTDAEPVKWAYASPNFIGQGQQATLTAITDTRRDGVEFEVTMPDGTVSRVAAGNSQSDEGKNLLWTAQIVLPMVGNYKVVAKSSIGGTWSSTGFTTSAYVVSSQDFTVSTSEDRRASDQILELIARWEGFSSTVYSDTLPTNPVATIGHGFTFGPGAVFYNGMTKKEGWAQLVNSINESSYTKEVNRFIHNNNLLMNQNQADALISFGYNIGAGYWNSSEETGLRTVMLNAVVPPDFSSGSQGARTMFNTVLRANPGMNSTGLTTLSKGTSVTVIGAQTSDPRSIWYQVRLSNGTTGWLNSGYVRFDNASSMTHDLNYTNAYALGTEMLLWCRAGGTIYAGLVYRRMGEANVYNYNDYSWENSRRNTYGYSYPAGFQGN